MASPAELSLECKTHSYSLLLKSVGEQQNDQTRKLEEFLARLEEERLKIEAFKRELPLCMQLLTNAMEASRQQLHTYKANQGPKPVLEEFIPLKLPPTEESEKAPNMTDKSNWMISAQLWSQATGDTHQQSPITSSKETEIGFGAEHRNGGAFLPFSKDRIPCEENQGLKGLSGLALASIDKEMEEKNKLESHDLRRESSCRVFSNGNSGVLLEQGKVGSGHADSQGNTNNTPANPQTHRKARRCWSPDLHRRFVNALQMLGGSQVATPKQIRELMKVDGLTNDEVKSHLQKYRLHTRRPSPIPQAPATGAPQLVVLGGIWVPPEYAATAHGGATAALYGPHPTTHPSPHYCAASLPQEFYTAPSPAPPHHQLHHHLHHHPQLHNQIHVYQPPSSQTHSSPESDLRDGTGDRTESMEDGKSESSSWKVDSSGENGSGNKGLMVRGEGSNGSEITLKF